MEHGLKITVSGGSRVGKDINIFERRCHARILRIAPVIVPDHRQFANVEYSFTWRAKHFDIEKIDTLRGQISRLVPEFINNWKYHISINYEETGGL